MSDTNKEERAILLDCRDRIMQMDAVSISEEIVRKDKRIAELERSRNLCHHYAGCTAINCCLDGDDCPESRSKSHE